MRQEVAQRAFKPKTGEQSGRAMSRADDVQGRLFGLADETIRVRVDERETGASAPVPEQTGLDIFRGDVTLDEGIVAQEDHGWWRVASDKE